jgi:hypothetical protein
MDIEVVVHHQPERLVDALDLIAQALSRAQRSKRVDRLPAASVYADVRGSDREDQR